MWGERVGHGWWGGGWLGMIVFWVLLVLAVAALIKWLSGRDGSTGGDTGTPMQVLKKRYARGEIDTEEFERKKRELEG